MTEIMNQARLHEVARVIDHPTMSAGRLIPRLSWAVDAQTGRPIGHWCLGEEADTPSLRV